MDCFGECHFPTVKALIDIEAFHSTNERPGMLPNSPPALNSQQLRPPVFPITLRQQTHMTCKVEAAHPRP